MKDWMSLRGRNSERCLYVLIGKSVGREVGMVCRLMRRVRADRVLAREGMVMPN